MKYLIAFLLFSPLFGQNNINNEIFLFSLSTDVELVEVGKGINISQNIGYDNQPSFYSADTLIYSRTRNGQTDIAGYSIENSETFWLSNTKMGSEFSPRRIPNGRDVAAVRLDTTGLQLLYRYEFSTGNSRILLPELKVGYFSFHNETTLVTAVLSGIGMDLVLNDLISGSSEVLLKDIGRSIQKVPQSNYMSYTISNEQNEMDLYLLDLGKEEPESIFLCALPAGVQDYTWIDQNRIVLGKGSEILVYDMLGIAKWTTVAHLAKYGLNNITRIAVNETGTRIALVAEIPENN